MRIVGIDPSLSSTGLCFLDYPWDGVTAHTESICTPSNKPIFERQRSIVQDIQKLLQKDDIVVLEEFAISVRFAPSGRFYERVELCGMLKLIANAKTWLPFFTVPPAMLKSFVAGKSSAHKDEVLKSVRETWHINVANDDEADAFGLAAYAAAVLADDPAKKKKTEKFLNYASNSRTMKRLQFLILHNSAPML